MTFKSTRFNIYDVQEISKSIPVIKGIGLGT